MKDFTTAEYVDPVLDWFRAMYFPITNKAVLDALNCDLLLQRNHKRDAKAVRKDDVFYTNCPPAKEVYDEIKSFAEKVSTEDGELNNWIWEEEQRFQNTVRDRLITEGEMLWKRNCA